MSDVECPYCEAEQKINHDDGYGYDESKTHSQECDQCGNVFSYTTEIHYCHFVDRADCLNDGMHSWQKKFCVPTQLVGVARCRSCGEEKIQ